MLPSNDGRTCLIFLDDVVRFCLPFIFAGLGYESFEAYAVKFTRDAEMELRGDAGEGLVEKVARGVKSRQAGRTRAFCLRPADADEMLRYFKRRFGIDRYDICVGGSRYHNMKDLMRFPDVGRGDLRFEPWPPAPVPDFDTADSTLDRVRRGDVLFHYPYQSFSNYLRLLREAALEPRRAYDPDDRLPTGQKLQGRQGADLRRAARQAGDRRRRADGAFRRGVEHRLGEEDAGSRHSGDFRRRGTQGARQADAHRIVEGRHRLREHGNFHEGNARTYTDVALLTADRRLTREVERVFEFIRQPAGRSPSTIWSYRLGTCAVSSTR